MNDSPLAVGVPEVGEVFAPTPEEAEASHRTTTLFLLLAGAAALAFFMYEEKER